MRHHHIVTLAGTMDYSCCKTHDVALDDLIAARKQKYSELSDDNLEIRAINRYIN